MQKNNTSLNYHLAQTVSGFVFSSGDSINRRIDILDACYGIVFAMVGFLDKSKADLERIDSDIMEMINRYEPVLDDMSITRENVVKKRLEYKSFIRDVFRSLMNVIYSNRLLDNSVMAKLEGKKWGDSD